MTKLKTQSVPDMLRPRIIEAIQSDPSHQFLQGVFATSEEEENFIYTIGNRERGLPDLLVLIPCGPFEAYAHVLNILGSMQAERGTPFSNGELVDYTAKFPALIIKASPVARDEYTVQAGQYYDTEDYEVLQVLFPDPQGIYPNDPHCDSIYQVPVLGGKHE